MSIILYGQLSDMAMKNEKCEMKVYSSKNEKSCFIGTYLPICPEAKKDKQFVESIGNWPRE